MKFPLGMLLLTLAAAHGAGEALSLDAYLQRVVAFNDQLQAQIIEYEVSKQAVEGALAAFEPELVVSGEYQELDRPNNAEELRNLGGVQFFKQRQELYSTAVETLLESGAQARVGMDVRRINNNLQQLRQVDQEWSTFFGLSFVQPLLRNAGPDVTLLPARVAAIESEQAYQEFRRQSMVILTGAEMAFWNLYHAQRHRAFADESRRLAQTLWEDAQARQEAGKAAALEVLNAKVAAAGREADFGVALQAVTEAENAFLHLMGQADHLDLEALVPPETSRPEVSLEHCLQQARNNNPQYLFRQHQIAIERARLRHAINQKRPSLDLRASFGLTGLSESLGDSLTDVGQADHPTWSIGMEFRLPLGGGKRADSAYKTARLRQQQARLQLHQLETELRGAVQNALQKVYATWQNVESYREAAALRQEILAAELEKQRVGKASNQDVLEAEEDLFEARNVEISNAVLHEQARLELEVLTGTVLEERGIDLSRAELLRRTDGIISNPQPHDMTDAEIEGFNRLKETYHKAIPVTP